MSFESAAATSTDAGISSRQSTSNRQNSSLVKTVSKSTTFLLQFLDVSDAAGDGHDVLFARDLGKRNREPQSAPANRPHLYRISGWHTTDAEIRRLVARSLGAGGDICRHGGRLRGGGIACDPSAAVLGVCFGLYALTYGMQSTLDYSLPNQLFPTAVRATAVGVVLAASRVASVVTAAGFPILLKYCNISEIFSAGSGVSILGVIVSLAVYTLIPQHT